jgi:hypothetical protein
MANITEPELQFKNSTVESESSAKIPLGTILRIYRVLFILTHKGDTVLLQNKKMSAEAMMPKRSFFQFST